MNDTTLLGFFEKLEFKLRRKIPVVHQTESSECGLACLSMICSYYGKTIDLISLRQKFNLSARGTSLESINHIANQLNMYTRTFSLEISELNQLKLPCILHWNLNHFVVLTGFKKNHFIIHDPSQGKRYVRLSEVSRCFTGIAMELWPAASFRSEKITKRIEIKSLVKNIQGLKSTLVKIFFYSCIIEFISILMPVGTQLVMDHVIPSSDSGLLSLICTALIFFIILRTAVTVFRTWTTLIMESLINVQWQSGLLSHLLRLPLTYFERRKMGDIQSRFYSLDILREMFTGSVVGALMDFIMVTGVLIMMFAYGGYLTLVGLFFTTLYILLRLSTYNRYRQLYEESLVNKARAGSYFMETLYGIATIKMQTMSDLRSSQWLNLEVDTINSGIRITKMDTLFSTLLTFIYASDNIIILWMGINLVMDNKMTIGMFVAFGAFRSQFSERITSLVGYLLQLKMMSLHNERISDIALTDTEDEISEASKILFDGAVSLECRDLSFKYDDYAKPVFSNLNFAISPGESVAIIGASGAGKSTLMKVMCGLFTPTSGKIIVNGEEIKKNGINNYRRLVGCVMQDDKLFAGSLRENICGFSESIDEGWMISCAKSSYVYEDIISLPMGFDTLIGELGEGLSGGQKQRIFIARALYRKPSILFLDEATSALDNVSESYVNQAIKSMNITRIIIAHRETTISSADRVINLN
ncbi:peptidase domain-containing ABC transporter [Edaphovirga cremea]|uniref:peptidase domain-containing ABC transporter n=1 Tax=Edaphovirga cremea TaxID=2267246 RepID=UPI000DF00390|nr:peptidase domain-containing ABC transporter [Edaphovirga cremea]